MFLIYCLPMRLNKLHGLHLWTLSVGNHSTYLRGFYFRLSLIVFIFDVRLTNICPTTMLKFLFLLKFITPVRDRILLIIYCLIRCHRFFFSFVTVSMPNSNGAFHMHFPMEHRNWRTCFFQFDINATCFGNHYFRCFCCRQMSSIRLTFLKAIVN